MRRRLLAAIAIISLTLGLLAWVDNAVLLRNPVELEARANLLLAKLFPDYDAKISHVAVDFPTHVVITSLRLQERGTGRTLVEVGKLEANLSLTDWLTPRDVLIQGVRVNIRRDKQGKLNFDVPAGEPGPRKKPTSGGLDLSSPVAITVDDARLGFEDEDVGSHALVRLQTANVTVFPGGRVTGTGSAEVGAIVPDSSPFAAGGTRELVEDIPGVVLRRVLPFVSFEIERRESGELRIPVEVGQAAVGPVLRSLLPRYVQEVIWDELNPTGLANARVTIRLSPTGDVRPEVFVSARSCTLRLKGFPYPIHDINGRFEISPGVVAWEDVTARLGGEGRVTKARGSFFLGGEAEKVTVFCYVEAEDVPLDYVLESSMPADIHAVYEQFKCKGVSGKSKVIVFKGPYMEDPQISIRSEVDGRQSAAFVDYPVRFTAEKGSFTLKEGGNVEVDAEGSLETGGHAKVDARVVHGDLMHVHVVGSGVPVKDEVLSRLDPEVRRMVTPFHPRGGTAGFDLVVSKSDPASRPIPKVAVLLDKVGCEPDIFPLPIAATGKLLITPSWREHAAPDEKPTIKVDLDLSARSRQTTAAVVSGSVVLDPAKGSDWSGDLVASCARLQIDQELERALPPELEAIRKNVSPTGALRDVRARVRSTESFEAEGSGDDLSAALASFPYRAGIDRFSLAREGRRISLRHVEGHTAKGGRFALEGSLEVPPEPGPARGNASRDPFVSVQIDAREVPLDATLVAALPEDARGPVEKLEPDRGKVDARLSVVLAPPLPLELRGDVTLAGARLAIHRLDPTLEGLEPARVEDASGLLRLEGDRLFIEGIKARFRGAPVTVGGSLALGARGGGDGAVGTVDGAAPAASGAGLDIVAHVDSLVLDEATRGLARGAARTALEHYPVEGPVDLDFRIQKGLAASSGTDVLVRIEPRGVKVVPRIVPLPFEDVRGSIEVHGDEPARVDLSARMGRARVEISRDKRSEAFAPPGSSIYRVRAHGIDPKEIAERGPEDFAKVIRDTDLTGLLDLSVDVAVPSEDRARSRFLAEIRTGGLDVTSGLRFEKAVGTLQVSGSVGRFAKLDLDGALTLERASWKKQDLKNAKIPVHFHDGVLLLGSPDTPFKGTFYGGELRGRVETDLKSGRYSGYIFVENATLTEAAQELARLGEESSKGPGTPIHGELTASLTFQGGGTDQEGRAIGIGGEGVVQCSKANLIGVPLVFGTLIDVFAGAAHGDSSFDPKSFDRVYAKMKLKPGECVLQEFRLDSDTLTLVGTKGTLGWDGKIHLDLLPWQPGVVFEKIFKQFAGVSVRGTVSDPVIKTMPFSNALDDMWNAVKKVVAPEEKEPASPGK